MGAMSAVGWLPLACAGHVLIDLPIFMGPVLVLIGWLLFVTKRERRREALEGLPLEGLPSADARA